MSRPTVEAQYRRFLLGVSAFLFVGTALELWLTEHLESTLQIVPFVLCGLGFAAVVAALAAPRRGVLLALCAVMAVVAGGGLLGVYEHLDHNLAFEMDIRPNATVSEALVEALYGASPLLAPGILCLAALLAAAAAYRHPALTDADPVAR